MQYFLGEGLHGGGTEGVDHQLDMLEDSRLDGYLVECVVALVDEGREKFGGVRGLFNAVHPELDVLVLVGKDFVRVVVYDRHETSLLGWLGRGRLTRSRSEIKANVLRCRLGGWLGRWL